MLKKAFLFALIMLVHITSIHAAVTDRPNVSVGTPYGYIEPERNVAGFMDYGITSPSEKNIEEESPDIYFSADEMENNKSLDTITATGDVNIIRENLSLKADKVIYNQKEDIIIAVGEVVIVEKNGSVVFSDYVELRDKMSEGEMENIKIIMRDKSRVAARRVERLKNNDKVMRNVVYSPCDVCSAKENPLWQLKSRKVIHDAKNKDVIYKDAKVEVKGVPIFYTPILSHPDPSVKRRTGFLAPTLSSNNYLGAALQPRFFWNISEHEDLILSPIISSDKGVVLGAGYRKFFYSGEIEGTGTFLKDPNKENDTDRGSLFLKSRYEINDYWLANADVNYATSGSYLKDLSLPNKDDAWLVSNLRFQGFDYRNYSSLEGYYYKQISSDIQELDKPYVAPLFSYENISDPGTYGAYTKTFLGFASVYREEETTSQRATMINSWILPYTSPYGEKYRLQASLKSDLYYVENYKNPENDIYDGTTGRSMPQVGLEWKLPFIKATETSRQILEPTIVAVAAPNGGNKINKIPNDDSMYRDLDDTNVLDLDRRAGYDRNDTGSRISYGLNWSAYGERTGRTSAFIAQTYNLDADENLQYDKKDKFSDYVGRIYAAPNEYLDLNYRFKLDNDNYELNYSELSAQAGPDILNTYIAYIYLKEDENSAIQGYKERKELYTAVGSKLTKDWSIHVYNRQDLASGGGSLEYGGFLTYEDECLKLITNLRKNNSNDPDYKGDFEISITFLLKTLGGFGSK